MADNSVTVAVRVRPMNKREIGLGTKCCIDMVGNQTVLQSTAQTHHKQHKSFAFDYSFWSMDPTNVDKFADQAAVFNGVGKQVLKNALDGFNACVFAYGQTGSGKSYSMMGCPGQIGLIPRITKHLYESIDSNQDSDVKYKVEVSYMEIYNEKVRDLLNPSDKTLKVREHAATGPYVDGLVKTAVQNSAEINDLIEEGGKSRTIAATNMNAESSRSHAVFTVLLTQETELKGGELKGEKVSRLSLVDLAGSERASKTGAAGSRLKEGSNINKSLTTLGLVISALAVGKSKFVPYRDSVLTWLLKDSLGGNSKTAMIATISPSADNYEETLSTLRYADRAKKIVNKAVVNEDPNTKVIRELKEEVEKLKRLLLSQGGSVEMMSSTPGGTAVNPPLPISSSLFPRNDQPETAKEKLAETEKLLSEHQKTWQEKVDDSEQIKRTRQDKLESMGISLTSRGIKFEGKNAYLVNLNPDPALSEMLVYHLPESGDAIVGSGDTSYIKLKSYGIEPEHSRLVVTDGTIAIHPFLGCSCHVNGERLTDERELNSGDRLLWGSNHYFKLTIPGQASLNPATGTPASESENIFEVAQREVMLNKLPTGAKETVEALERQLLRDDDATTVVTGIDEQERSGYMDEINRLKREIEKRDKRSESPKRAEKIKRRTRLKEGVRLLKVDLARAQHLVMEANSLCERLNKDVHFSVTLRIPPERLGPSVEPESRLLCSAAIKLVRPGREDSIWCLDKLEDRMSELRSEIYSMEDDDDFSECNLTFTSTPMNSQPPLPPGAEPNTTTIKDPFYEEQQQSLIGVASFYLESLFYDLDEPFEYVAPIVSPNGTSAGKLAVRMARISGFLPLTEEEISPDQVDNELTVQVELVQALGLSPTLAHFVECQYVFPGTEEIISVPPKIDESMSPKTERDRLDVCYKHSNTFTIQLQPEVLSEFERGALKIKLLGHQDRYRAREKQEDPGIDWRAVEEEGRSLAERWADVSKRIRLDVEIQELEDGTYQPVELTKHHDDSCGGVFQLRAGMSRRILVSTKTIQECGQLPLVLGDICAADIGSVLVDSDEFSQINNPDSYQEKDLQYLRDKWSAALDERKTLLDVELQKPNNDATREKALFHQVAVLAEERNSVLVPQQESGMPGAPEPVLSSHPGHEQHVPVMYLGVDQEGAEEVTTGEKSILPGENEATMTALTIIRNCWGEQGGTHAVFAWDSSVHDCQHLNRPDERTQVYMVLRLRVKLALPIEKEIVLRKRLHVQIQHQRRGLMQSLKKNLRLGTPTRITKNSVVYEIISSLPLPADNATLDSGADDLATAAAAMGRIDKTSNDESDQWDPNSAFDRYVKSLQSVEKMLDIDRLKQQTALHNRLEELGIPRIFGRVKHGYIVQSILSPGPFCPPPLGMTSLRHSATMPSISKHQHQSDLTANTEPPLLGLPSASFHIDDSELHAVQRPDSALSNVSDISNISHSNSAACSAIVSDMGSSDEDDDEESDSSESDTSSSEYTDSESDDSSDETDSEEEKIENEKEEINQLSDLCNLHGSTQK